MSEGARLNGRVALVTGCGQGIGRAIALRFAAERASVVCNDVVADRAETIAGKVQGCGGTALAVAGDVSNREHVDALIQSAVDRFHALDILVNNAGIYRLTPAGLGPVEADTEESWDRVLAVNLKGVFLMSRAALAVMKQRSYGRIVNLGSLAGKTGGVVSTASYSVSKAGVICLTKCLAREGASFGITANAIAPGQIDTDMTAQVLQRRSRSELERAIPLGRLGTPDDIAAAAAFLASEDAQYITGEVLDVNGGIDMD
jgi:3-oxoacyl-[acyl-carrier protein] reductase